MVRYPLKNPKPQNIAPIKIDKKTKKINKFFSFLFKDITIATPENKIRVLINKIISGSITPIARTPLLPNTLRKAVSVYPIIKERRKTTNEFINIPSFKKAEKKIAKKTNNISSKFPIETLNLLIFSIFEKKLFKYVLNSIYEDELQQYNPPKQTAIIIRNAGMAYSLRSEKKYFLHKKIPPALKSYSQEGVFITWNVLKNTDKDYI